MTPEENVAFLGLLSGTVAGSASDIADGMAGVFQSRVQWETLRETSHGVGEFWKATRDRPPAYASGNLARSIVRTAAFGGIRASATVGATAKYAAIQEYGGWTWPSNHKFMHWVNSGGSWFMKTVYIPEHPYMRPTVEAVIRDGSLQRAAIDAFMEHMFPLVR
jgi:phage gpG-like protein